MCAKVCSAVMFKLGLSCASVCYVGLRCVNLCCVVLNRGKLCVLCVLSWNKRCQHVLTVVNVCSGLPMCVEVC